MVVLRSLLYAIVACAIIGQTHLPFNGEIEWYAWGYGLMAEMFILSVLHYRRYSYAELREKYMAFIMCSFPLIQATLFTFGNNSAAYYFSFAALVSCSISWLLWSIFRRYELSSDELCQDRLCIIAKRPRSFYGFISSMFGDPYGHYAFCVKGTVFHYRKGKFVQTPIEQYPMDNVTIIRTRKNSEAARIELVNMLGSKWSLINNCWTLRHVI